MRKLTTVEILVTLLILVLPLLLFLPIDDRLLMNDDMFQEYFSHGFWSRAVLEGGEFPLWCPYAGGGYPLYAHPHDASTALPLVPAVLLLGEVQGIRLNLLLIWLLGIWGLRWLLLHEIKLEGNAAWPILMLYSLCLPLWFQRIGGNYNETLIFALPAILALQRMALRRPAWLLAAAALLATLLCFGKFTAISAGAICAAYSLRLALGRDARERGQRPIALAQLALLAALSIGLAALKLLPMLDLLGRAKLGEPFDYGPWFQHTLRGSICCVLATLGLLMGLRTRSWFWPGLLCASLLLSAGSSLPFNLARLLSHVPLLGTVFNDPGKYWSIPVWVLLCLTLAVYFKTAGAKHKYRLLAPYILVLLILPLLAMGYKKQSYMEPSSVCAIDKNEFFQVVGREMPRNGLRTSKSNEYCNLLRNVGTIDWYSDQIDLPAATIPRYFVIPPQDAGLLHHRNVPQPVVHDREVANPDYRGEAWIEPADAGRVLEFTIGVNRIEALVEIEQPGLAVINQNHDPHWQLGDGSAPVRNGLLSSKPLDAGRHQLVWRYRPRPWRSGLLISAITLLAGIALLGIWEWRNRCAARR
ncbi:MAG: hypothetical protein P9M14_02525 [Candidatus Alcyoniella australis]|nr:hypothetical protein [Candidatus Alcyoniella australis]